MPAAKRKSDDAVEVVTKRQRKTSTLCNEANLTEEELETMTANELIKTIKTLQSALQESHKKTQVLAETNGNKQPTIDWTPEQLSSRVDKIRDLVGRDIKKQMKWQPTCKEGRTKWSYHGMVPNADVFKALFNIEKNAKAFKMKKLDRWEFCDMFEDIEVSCRYSRLRITGENVNLKWNPEELTFQLSGTYGI